MPIGSGHRAAAPASHSQRARRGQAVPGRVGDEGPDVVGVDGEIGIAAGRLDDLLDEPWQGQPERRRHQRRGRQTGEDRRDDPDRPVAQPARRRLADRLRVEARFVGPMSPDRPHDDDRSDDRDDDPQLRLRDRGDRAPDRRPLGLVAPDRAQGQEDEDEPDRVDLAPDDAVEPGDRDEQHERGAEERPPVVAAQLADHREDEGGADQVGDDGGQLDQVTQAAESLADIAHRPQDIQVAGGVVVEERPIVEAERAVLGKVAGPEPERVQVDARIRSLAGGMR